jgi:hypothetical protein
VPIARFLLAAERGLGYLRAQFLGQGAVVRGIRAEGVAVRVDRGGEDG